MTSRPVPPKSPPGPAARFKPPPRTPVDPGDGKFPVFPPRGDMQNPIYLHRPGHLAVLSRHLGAPETTLVLGEVPVGRDIRQRRGLRVPDLMVVFSVDSARVITDRGYSIEEWGKPPDFVLEVASETTGQRDIGEKRDDYAAFGIPEYWRFDPSGGLYHRTHLAGDRLVGEAYQPIHIATADAAHHWGRSDVLGLDLCWEDGRLRWYDPAARRYLRTFDEEAEDRIAAESERDTEHLARLTAESQRDAERSARLDLEERLRELEAENRRLRS